MEMNSIVGLIATMLAKDELDDLQKIGKEVFYRGDRVYDDLDEVERVIIALNRQDGYFYKLVIRNGVFVVVTKGHHGVWREIGCPYAVFNDYKDALANAKENYDYGDDTSCVKWTDIYEFVPLA